MPRINKVVKKPVKRKKLKKTISVKIKRAKTKIPKTKPIKNPVAYFGCMQACCQGKISPKKIDNIQSLQSGISLQPQIHGIARFSSFIFNTQQS